MKYRILQAKSTTQLEENVNEFLEDGWVPDGSLFMDGDEYYTQSLIYLSAYEKEKS